MSSDILIVDDEADIRNLVHGILADEGYETRLAANAKEAYEEIDSKAPGLIILDIWLQDSEQDGLDILTNTKKDYPHVPIIMISGHGTIETAVSSIKEGAYDFIEKPFKSDRLLLMVKRALEAAELRRENEALKQRSIDSPSELIGSSSVIQNIKQALEKVATANSRVLLTGEPGTGKDIAARMIYQLSERAGEPFLVLNCATLHPERLEAELFGSIEGGNNQSAKTGVLEQANGGTLFLDEVGDMPLETQGKIVRVLQEQRFQKLGDNKEIEVDVRILASTNKNLEEAIENGDFRQDLYYRLNVVPVHMSPLREHPEDIPELVEYFSELICRQSGSSPRSFSPATLSLLQKHEWSGNVRQLRNVVEWVLIMNNSMSDEVIEPEQLPPQIYRQESQTGEPISMTQQDAFADLPLREAREMFERQYLLSQVDRFGGNISKTAQFIGMERSALHRKLKSLHILKAGKDTGAEETPETKRKRA